MVYQSTLGHDGLLTDIDTIQELTDILVLDHGGLGDLSARQGDLGKVNTGDLDLILYIGSAVVCHTIHEFNTTNLLLTQKVADLNSVTNTSDVDRKVSIAEAHLVLEALGNTSDHVLDVRADSSDGGNVLSVTKPQVNLECLSVVDLLDIKGDVLEGSLQRSLWALNSDVTSLNVNGDYEKVQKEKTPLAMHSI